MLGIWLGVALVNISGYQPIAEQTWVQLNPEYYPVHRAVPPIFVAWRGNQFPPLEQKKKNGHWQILFPARLVPPFDLFEGEAQLSKAYLARLKRIDEMAYGMAPQSAVQPVASGSLSPEDQGGAAFIAEFSLPGSRAGRGRADRHPEPGSRGDHSHPVCGFGGRGIASLSSGGGGGDALAHRQPAPGAGGQRRV